MISYEVVRGGPQLLAGWKWFHDLLMIDYDSWIANKDLTMFGNSQRISKNSSFWKTQFSKKKLNILKKTLSFRKKKYIFKITASFLAIVDQSFKRKRTLMINFDRRKIRHSKFNFGPLGGAFSWFYRESVVTR